MRMWFSKKRPASCVPPIARAPAPSCLCEDARPAQSGHREPGGLPECVSDRESCGRGAYAARGAARDEVSTRGRDGVYLRCTMRPAPFQ